MGTKKVAAASAVILGLCFLANGVRAQALKDQAPAPAAPPKTRLEAFTGESGAVIVKGYTSTGVVRGAGSVEVSALTLRNAKTNEETKGLSITLGNMGAYVSETSAFVDYDEINGLLAGIDYIANTDASSTKLANFEAIYSTKGSVRITVFNDSTGTNAVAVNVSRFGRGAFLKMSDLAKIRDAVAAAKQILDNPDSVAAKGSRLAPTATPIAAAPTPAITVVPTPAQASPQPGTAKPKPRSPVPSAPLPPMKLN